MFAPCNSNMYTACITVAALRGAAFGQIVDLEIVFGIGGADPGAAEHARAISHYLGKCLDLTKIPCGALVSFSVRTVTRRAARVADLRTEPADARAQMQWMQAERSTKHHEHVLDIQGCSS